MGRQRIRHPPVASSPASDCPNILAGCRAGEETAVLRLTEQEGATYSSITRRRITGLALCEDLQQAQLVIREEQVERVLAVDRRGRSGMQLLPFREHLHELGDATGARLGFLGVLHPEQNSVTVA